MDLTQQIQEEADNITKYMGYNNKKISNEPLSIEKYMACLKIQQDTVIYDNILTYNIAETSSQAYEESYSSLFKWVSKATDKIKVELELLLYPIFIHCFLDLMENENFIEAQNFFTKHQIFHQKIHGKELKEIYSNSNSDPSEIQKRFRTQKYKVLISLVSFELFVSFLQKKRFMLLLKIAKLYLNITIVDIHWTDSPLEKSIIDYESPELFQKWLTEIEDPPLFELLNFHERKFPLEKLNDIAQKFEKISERISLLNKNFPSVFFSSLPNFQNKISCAQMAPNQTCIVAGFSDSTIKTWKLSEDPYLFYLKKNKNQNKNQNQNNIKNKNEEKSEVKESIEIEAEAEDVPKMEIEENIYEETPSFTMVGHHGPVHAIRFSENSELILSCSQDKSVRLWKYGEKTNLAVYKGHHYAVWDVQFSPLGYYFATGSFDKTARLWATDRTFPIRVFVGHLADVDCVTFHPNCNYIASGSSDCSIRIWDIQSSNCVRILNNEHKVGVTSVAFSPQGNFLASGDENGEVVVWDIGQGEAVYKFGSKKPIISNSLQIGSKKQAIWSLQFSPFDGNILVAGTQDSSIRFFDLSSYISDPSHDLSTPNNSLVHVGFSSREILRAVGIRNVD